MMQQLQSLLVLFCVVIFTAECRDPDIGKGMVEIVTDRGYPIEEHYVTTEDGYILGVFRIPYGRNNVSTSEKKPPILLQHALLDSSYAFVNNYPDESLAYILADNGYDVWLGNNRGNSFSKKHEVYPVDSAAFWNFSFDQMAKYDVPATVSYVLEQTGFSKIPYIGHSQGTTQAFAGLSINMTLQNQISLFIALAPATNVYHTGSVLIKIIADLDVDIVFDIFGVKDFLPNPSLIQKIAPGICELIPRGCDDVLFLICGPTNHTNASRIDVYVSETPAGTSVKNMVHWAQGVRKDVFEMYNYGCGEVECRNEIHYHQKTPPAYNVSNIVKTRIAIFAGTDDYLADPTDVARLKKEIRKEVLVFNKTVEGYAHLDFTWGYDAHVFVYEDVLRLLARY